MFPVFVRHQQSSGLDAEFLLFLRISNNGREKISRINISTGLEPMKDFRGPLIPASYWTARTFFIPRLKPAVTH